MQTLVASAARTASGNSGALTIRHPDRLKSAVLLLTVSVAATDAADTLDIYVQHSVDGGTTYDDFIHFTQVLGNGGAKKFITSWARDLAPESELKAPADKTLAAGVLQGPLGGTWRIAWVIVDSGDANQSFTFKVEAQLMRDRR